MRFKHLYADPIGAPIDRPESSSAILKYEPGEIICYRSPSSIAVEKQEFKGKFPRFKLSGFFKVPDRYIYSVSDAGITGQQGLVYDIRQRCFIDESSKEWVNNIKNSPYVNAVKLPPITFLKGITLSFLTIGADGGFYHFLFESLVKAGIYSELTKQADYLLFNGPETDWKLKWLNRAQIDLSKIIWVNSSSHYQCGQLLFTSRLIADQQINNWSINVLKQLLNTRTEPTQVTTTRHIIWITRRGLEARSITWEDHLLANFPEIQCIDLASFSAEDTISIMNKSTHIIAPHGAGLSNLYLCQPGTQVLEIYPENAYFKPCYHRLSSVCGLQHSVTWLDFKDKDNVHAGLNALSLLLKDFLC